MQNGNTPELGGFLTYCEDCDFVSNRKDRPRYWTCLKYPKFTEQYVCQFERVDEPYSYCRYVNNGNCPHFKPKDK